MSTDVYGRNDSSLIFFLLENQRKLTKHVGLITHSIEIDGHLLAEQVGDLHHLKQRISTLLHSVNKFIFQRSSDTGRLHF
jgi:hypothetical protein